jgi:transcription antitermination protein NusB
MTDPSPETAPRKPDPQKPGSARTAARLAAVQALYQIETTGERPTMVMAEFRQYRLGQVIGEDQYIKADDKMFIDIVDGVTTHLADLDAALSQHLAAGWSMARIDSIMRQTLRCGAYELTYRKDVPPKVVISEYVDVAYAFVEKPEASFVNGVLDGLAKANS